MRSLLSLVAPMAPPLLHLVEALVVRRLLSGTEVRFRGEAIEVRQGLVFVKMLHRSEARWLELA